MEGIKEALAAELYLSWNIKITILGLGAFKTRISDAQGSLHVVPPHPAYVGADFCSAAVRANVESGKDTEMDVDENKAAWKISNMALDASAGLRVPLGLDAIAAVKMHLDELRRDAATAEKWNINLR